MADPVIYIRNPSLNFGATLSDAIIDDFREFVAIEDAGIEAKLERLANGPRFIAKDDLEAIFGPASQEVVVRIIRWVTRTGLEEASREDLRYHLGRIQNEKSQPAFSPEQLELLGDRIAKLARSIGLRRQVKAESLSKATGMRLEQLQLICDFRPVFDEERKTIEALLPLTILKMVCEGVDGLPVGMEAILSVSDVDDLFDLVSKAREKLAQMRTFTESANLPIPKTDLTRLAEKR